MDIVFQPESFSSSSSYPYSSYIDLYKHTGIMELDEEMNQPNGVCSGNWECIPEDIIMGNNSSSSPDNCSNGGGDGLFFPMEGRRKRRRARAMKNKEEVENQRMTHIAVERNRRKQMNEYLAVLRTMMPPSYVHRGDQASIVGGAINFVKELEQLLHSLQAQKHHYSTCYSINPNSNMNHHHQSTLFSDFFTFPQYSTTISACSSDYHNPISQTDSNMPEKSNAVADVEVSLVDGHANIKVLSRKQPRHLLKMVVGLQSLCLNILHLNVTSFGYMVLYSFSVKVDDNCEVTSVNEIAAAVYEVVERIQEESCRLEN